MILGIYHSTHEHSGNTAEVNAAITAQRLRDLETIARAGFNTIACPLNLQNAPAFLKRAGELGVGVLVENNDPQGLMAMVTSLKYYSPGAVLGYQVVDDADNGKYTAAQIKAMSAQVKAIDPEALTYISAGSGKAIYFTGLSDALGVQEYPIPFEPISRAYTAIKPIVDRAGMQPVIVNAQAFDWKRTIGTVVSRPPTPAEVQQMAYSSIGAGVKGVLFYCFTDSSGWRLSDDLPLWRECSMVVKELKAVGLRRGW
jgi:hypothetical protein